MLGGRQLESLHFKKRIDQDVEAAGRSNTVLQGQKEEIPSQSPTEWKSLARGSWAGVMREIEEILRPPSCPGFPLVDPSWDCGS
jgi:hypothetical protein